MRVKLVSGSYPPEACGIGHYSFRLARALKDAGTEVDVISGPGWGPRRISQIIRSLESRKNELLHIQYPSEGFGWSLAPQFLAMFHPAVVTIHELSRVGILRKLSILPLLVGARRLIFTSAFELTFACRWLPSIRRRSKVIEIGSNIPVFTSAGPRKLDEIIYFGLIVPNKGIEEVMRLASLAMEKGLPLRVRVIGATVPRFHDYASQIVAQSRDLPVDLDFDMDDDETGRRLAQSAVAYLPFPGGASTGRGSLKALLACGTAVITTRGPQTTPALADAVLFASGAEEALNIGLELIHDPARLEKQSIAALKYAETFGWDKIAAEHLEVYHQFASGK